MRKPERKRTNPKPRRVSPLPAELNAEQIAARARYIGSAFHKDIPSFAGLVPHPRPDASICPRHLGNQQGLIQDWLRAAIANGQVSGNDLRGDFPHKVWHREGNLVYEAVGDSNGLYHGYPLESEETVHGL